MARHGLGQENEVIKTIVELTPKMVAYVHEVMDGEDKVAKLAVTTKILPKIIDKMFPNQIEHSGGITMSILLNNLHGSNQGTIKEQGIQD